MSDTSLFQRLQERKLVQWALAYLAGAFFVYTGLDPARETWGLPATVVKAIHLLLITGFFITLVLAWYHGEKGRQRVSGPELLMVSALLVVAGIAVTKLPGREEAAVGLGGPPRLAGEDDRPSIAVLPFYNRSGSPDDAYFTDGLHSQLITQLAQLSGVSVRALTSVLVYRDSPKNLREIGQALNARYIIEGGVQRAGGRLRINVQLSDALTDESVWADTYDRTWSVENLFSIQTEIVGAVADSVRAAVSPEEMARIEAPPTRSPEAYELYLRATDLFRAGEVDNLDHRAALWYQAVDLYERAVDIDPGFALAYARLALSNTYIFYWAFEGREALDRARDAVDLALTLDPNLGEAHLAQGQYRYHGNRDYEGGLQSFEEARKYLPGEVRVHRGIAAVLRRMGRYREALEFQRQAFELDPRDARSALEIGYSLGAMRQNEEAVGWFRRGQAISPNIAEGYGRAAEAYLRLGRIEDARGVLAQSPDSSDWSVVLAGFWTEAYARDFPAARTWLDRVAGPVLQTPYGPRPVPLFRGHLRRWGGDLEGARDAYSDAREVLESLDFPADRPILSTQLTDLEIAFAGMALRDQALARMDSTTVIRRSARDPYGHPMPFEDLAFLHVILGDFDMAIEMLESLLKMEYHEAITTESLRLDPRWDPIRARPRFQALLEGRSEH
jgi:TolB-like protein/Tfp pilus assembly protein PilF